MRLDTVAAVLLLLVDQTLTLCVVDARAPPVARGKSGKTKPRAGDRRQTGYWKKDKRGRWATSDRRVKEVNVVGARSFCFTLCSLGSWACSHCAVQLKRVAERKPLHTKTLARCFQSLRIAVNDERRALKVRLLLGGCTRYSLRRNTGWWACRLS